MTALIVAGIALLAFALLGLAAVIRYWDTYDLWGVIVIGVILAAAVGVIVCFAIAISTNLSARYDRDRCDRIGVQTERDVKFERYTSFSWDCLTPSSDGWVSIDRVIKAEVDS